MAGGAVGSTGDGECSGVELGRGGACRNWVKVSAGPWAPSRCTLMTQPAWSSGVSRVRGCGWRRRRREWRGLSGLGRALRWESIHRSRDALADSTAPQRPAACPPIADTSALGTCIPPPTAIFLPKPHPPTTVLDPAPGRRGLTATCAITLHPTDLTLEHTVMSFITSSMVSPLRFCWQTS